MRGKTMTVSEELIVETCYSCGVLFAMAKGFRDQRIEDRQSFCCPAGHPQSYTGVNHKERAAQLQREVDRLKQQEARHEDEKRELRIEAQMADRKAKSATAAKTRIETRMRAGVCPICKRSFAGIAEHMATKHPISKLEDCKHPEDQ